MLCAGSSQVHNACYQRGAAAAMASARAAASAAAPAPSPQHGRPRQLLPSAGQNQKQSSANSIGEGGATLLNIQ
jgi:hypothetical protein